MEQDTTTPVTTTNPVVTPQNTESHIHQISKGIVVGLIVFSTILIAVIYLSTVGVQNPAPVPPQVPGASTIEADAAATALSVQGTSDEVADIEADLNATDFGSLEDIDKI